MAADYIFQGSLFSTDFLRETITNSPDWRLFSDAEIDSLAAALRAIFNRFPIGQRPNETQTEDDLIWPILARLGWTVEPQTAEPCRARGREDVPDGVLFQDADTKAQANTAPEEWRRYDFGLAIVESKRWQRPLDRQSGRRGEETAPSTQMLRYLRRVDDLTTGKLRWGILTNGGRWRLYYQGARSVSEQFFELDLAAVLALPGHEGGLFALAGSGAPSLAAGFRARFQPHGLPARRRAIRAPSISARSTKGASTKSASPKTSPTSYSGRFSRSLRKRSTPPRRTHHCRKSEKRP